MNSKTAYWVEEDSSLSPSHRKSRSKQRKVSSHGSRSPSTHAPPISRSPSPSKLQQDDIEVKQHPKSQNRNGNDPDRPTAGKKRRAHEHSDAEGNIAARVSATVMYDVISPY